MGVFNNTGTNTEGPSIANTELAQHVGGGTHTRGWLHALQTEHERVCCHDESDSTRRRWCKGNLQPNTWEEVLPVEMSQLLTQNKTNTKIPRKLNRTKHGITPTYCYFCQIFKRVGRKICGVQNEQHVYLTGTFWPNENDKCPSKKRCLSLHFYYYYIFALIDFMEFIFLFDLANLEIHTWCAAARHSRHVSLPEVTDLRTLIALNVLLTFTLCLLKIKCQQQK